MKHSVKEEHAVARFILVVLLTWGVSIQTLAHAQGLYKWTDSHGIVHYTNTPTNTKAKTVDDALPPAANFQRPAPPPEPTETAKPTAKDSGSSPAPQAATPEPSSEESQPTATEGQAPDLSATQPNS